jgi:MYXO-CTERM domain-containing protein
MRRSFLLGSTLVSVLALASSAHAETLYASPTGTATSACTTRENACDLASAGNIAQAGDTVILLDGVYDGGLFVTNSGTADAWITFKADDCATPIIEGTGPAPGADDQSGGVHSEEGSYLRFDGLVVRGFNIGFGNAWAGGVDSTDVSNGNWDIQNCISYSNGRTGFTFFSAPNFTLRNSISAHNGSSTAHSWSSGVTLFESTGTLLVERVVSFENMDAEENTDGSGFIVDENSSNALFRNNLAFRNGGSCLRMTRSSGTRFINNTCFHNAQNPAATGPTNPAELYFTNNGSPDPKTGVTFLNNALISTTNTTRSPTVVINKPGNWSTSNYEARTEAANDLSALFTDPTGTNPNFSPPATSTNLVGKGTTGTDVPTDDLGLDPKCLVKRAPVMVGSVASGSWWQYDIDIDYIKSIGGVAKCFNPAARSGTPDVGAYKSGAIATAPACVPSSGSGGAGGAGGSTSTGGAVGAGGLGGSTSSGGTTATAGGATSSGGTTATGSGGAVASGGSNAGGPGAGGASNGGASSAATGGASAYPGSGGEVTESGCGCRVGTATAPSTQALGALGLIGALAALVRRRRSRPERI